MKIAGGHGNSDDLTSKPGRDERNQPHTSCRRYERGYFLDHRDSNVLVPKRTGKDRFR